MAELIERFRPNLVVQTKRAFEEEDWSTVRIGRETFTVRLLASTVFFKTN